MLNEYYQIAALLQQVPAISWVDLDQNQLKEPGKHNTIFPPGVLVGFSEIEWETHSDGSQTGDGFMTIKLVVQLMAQTYVDDPYGSVTNLEPLQCINELDDVLRTIDFVRPQTRSHEYPASPFYVVEKTYPVRPCRPARDYETVMLTVPVQYTPQLVKP